MTKIRAAPDAAATAGFYLSPFSVFERSDRVLATAIVATVITASATIITATFIAAATVIATIIAAAAVATVCAFGIKSSVVIGRDPYKRLHGVAVSCDRGNSRIVCYICDIVYGSHFNSPLRQIPR